ncbi:ABC transporter substrate-binding protein [Corynebacterium guangdongense]|uniref:Sn-glycerol 3-phosphate transport system substrate-binding protein n=1 Tax=Corynebacterium guangdongense TaxID=1783348 RepID=A0ABU2A326_9CORY|nr:ABC transporter substrate-binding protein [Corynebacterium guangdongense]MDR7330483.1 sn-glycerol 3-phosphate transport system substrate-binding protein [Corynebacterium guangdongense]WJZ19039.1 sn-glycerol-3-phosphate-binding periplasmic protein UgpB precursor [Corynebacterium guangdongense]
MAFNPTLSRRQLLAAFGITGAGLTLAACAGTGGATGGGAAAGDANKIVFWSNHPASSKDVELELIARFEAENPDLTVELVDAGANYGEVSQKFNAALTGTDLPDVVVLSDTEWFNFALNEATANIDEIAERTGVDVSGYVESLYNDYAFGGGHNGLPYARSTVLFYYNKDVWAEAGLPDRGPETWEEFSEWGPQLQEVVGDGKKAHGWGDAVNYLSWTFHGPMRTMDGAYSDEWDSRLTSPETVAAVNWFKSTIDDGYATVSADVTNEFSTGLIASCIQSTGDLSSVMETAGFNVGVAELPNPKGQGGAVTGGAGLGIPAGISEERQDNALKFIDFITNVENTTFWSRETGYVPVREGAAEDAEHATFLEENPEYRVAIDQLPKTLPQDNFRVLLPGGDRTIGDALESIALTGADVEATLADAEQKLVTIYERDIEPLL